MMDTFNKFLVGARGEDIVIQGLGLTLSKADALILAVWLAALADSNDEFDNLLEAVRNT